MEEHHRILLKAENAELKRNLDSAKVEIVKHEQLLKLLVISNNLDESKIEQGLDIIKSFQK